MLEKEEKSNNQIRLTGWKKILLQAQRTLRISSSLKLTFN